MGAVIEIRTYRTIPGAREELLEVLRTRSFPAHLNLGMKVLGPFPSADDDVTFVWSRGFPDAESRGDLAEAFYGSPLWVEELEPQLMPLIAHCEAVLVEDEVSLWRTWPEAA
jgi:hypothetical protein